MPSTKEGYLICPLAIVAICREIVKVLGISIERKPGEPGRPPTPFEKVMNAIWFRLRTGCQWKAIPECEYLCNGTTAHRWFMRMTRAGVFELLYCVLVALYLEGGVEKLRALGIDCTLCPAPLGGAGTGPNPTDRGKSGVKISIVVEHNGRPLAIELAAANVHDFRLLGVTLEKLAAEVLARLADEALLVADKGYDYPQAHEEAQKRGFRARIQSRGQGYGAANAAERKLRAACERLFAWLKAFRAVRVCWSRLLATFASHVYLACSYLLVDALPPSVQRLILRA